MNKFTFEMSTRLHFGAGKLATALQAEVRNLGIKQWLLVADKGISKLGLIDRIQQILTKTGCGVAVYSGIDSEPSDRHVEEGVARYRDNSCRGVVAIGGGSTMDAGKAIAVMATNKGSITDYKGFDKIKVRKAPLIAIPTTAGTGSEVTRAAGITDTKSDIKMVIISSTVAPEVAIDDPELTLSLPADLTAQTGLDALSHAIEAYVSKQGNPISDSLSLEAIRIISGNLATAWRKGEDLDARSRMMLGQFIAGMAVMNAQVCLVHGMSRPLGVYFHLPHGLANGLLLPLVMRYNVEHMENPRRYADIATAWGMDVNGVSEKNAALKAVQRVEQLCVELQMPGLQELGLDGKRYETLLPRMAEDCLSSGSPANNPVAPSQADVVDLYRRLWEA
jgi:alcohol dehydrogenase